MATKRLHFLGITGHTMRGLALAAQGLGYTVTGTDVGGKPPGSTWLDEHKITWWGESDPAHLAGVDRVIMSGGTPTDDPELVAAQKEEIPIESYAAFVGKLAETKRRLVVGGTHGKTTTTALLSWIFESAGRHPDFLVGIQPRNFDTSVRLSDATLMILEGDEYKASTLDLTSKLSYYRPDVLVVTSLEMDHPDLFTNVGEIEQRFAAVIEAMPLDGRVLYWAGAPALRRIAAAAACAAESYGEDGVWHAGHIRFTPEGIAFDVYHHDVYQGHLRVPLYGAHNVDNATAAVAVALGEGLAMDQIQEACDSFAGAARRFEVVSGPQARIRVIDDYAHHPSEISATIAAARQHFGGRVLAVVRPHTYSRTKELLPEYRQAVGRADRSFIAEIEGAREQALKASVSGADIAAGKGTVEHLSDRAKLVEAVVVAAQPGDTVLSMTVSGYDNLAEELAQRLG